MTNEQIKEFIKCRKDLIYFLTTYGKIRHPVRGLLNFEMWDFQKDCVQQFLQYPYNIIRKSRQLGISTLAAGYIVWRIIFLKQQDIYILATKGDVATNLISKVKVFIEYLPEWMRPKLKIDQRQSIETVNGSKVVASTTTKNAGRSEALSLLVIDEAAFIDNLDKIWTSISPTISSGGDCILLSSTNGVGNFFHKTWVQAEEGVKFLVGGTQRSFNPIFLPWQVHPERNEEWAIAERAKVGEREFLQEYEAAFHGSGNTVFDVNALKWYEDEKFICDPIEKLGYDEGLWIWKRPQEGRKFIIAADISRGDGADFSTIEVFDEESYEQVAEYKGKLHTDIFGSMLVQLATQYNNALLVPENNNHGWATVQKIIDLGYQNLYWMNKKDRLWIDVSNTIDIRDPFVKDDKNIIPGFATSGKAIRETILKKLEEDIRHHFITIHSQRFYDECQTFIFKPSGKMEHMSGYNDDLIMAMAIGAFIRGVYMRMSNAGQSVANTLVNQMSYTNTKFDVEGISNVQNDSDGSKIANDSYVWKIGGGNDNNKEDLRWLI